MDNKLLLWLWLTEVFGTANPRKWEATARFDTIEECFDAYSHGDLEGLNHDEAVKAQKLGFNNAEKIVEYCNKNNINIYCYESEGFPQRLKEIYNPPSVIYAKHESANLDFLDDNVSVSVVGARNLDDYYEKVTYEIAGQLAASGIVVASGFAVGADTVAHRAAINNGGKTVAVLGSGIDYDYPKGTMKFKDEIAQHGAVISEFEPDHMAGRNDFRARNRLLSGLSHGVLVTQASTTSGSLNTVANAVSQGRDIFCVPPRDIFEEKYHGVVQIIRDGAVPVFDARDIIYEYYENYSHKISYSKTVQNFVTKSEDASVFSDGKASGVKPVRQVRKTENKAEAVAKPKINSAPDVSLDGLSEIQQKIVSVLKGKQMLADEISRETGLSVMDLFGEITELEIDGIVKSLPGNRYSL